MYDIYLCMKIIITESQSTWLLRRHEKIKKSVFKALTVVDPDDYNLDEYIDEICWQVIDSFGVEQHFEKMGAIREVMDFVKEKYSPFLGQYYYEMKN